MFWTLTRSRLQTSRQHKTRRFSFYIRIKKPQKEHFDKKSRFKGLKFLFSLCMSWSKKTENTLPPQTPQPPGSAASHAHEYNIWNRSNPAGGFDPEETCSLYIKTNGISKKMWLYCYSALTPSRQEILSSRSAMSWNIGWNFESQSVMKIEMNNGCWRKQKESRQVNCNAR